MEDFRTELRKEKEQKELEIYTEYQQLVSVPGNSKVEVSKHLCRKYKISTISTIYALRKRVEKRLKYAQR